MKKVLTALAIASASLFAGSCAVTTTNYSPGYTVSTVGYQSYYWGNRYYYPARYGYYQPGSYYGTRYYYGPRPRYEYWRSY